MPSPNPNPALLLLILAAAAPLTALSDPPLEVHEPPETTYRLNTVVVTATRTPEPTERIPANVTVIGAEEIEQSGVASLVDALRLLGGVPVRGYSDNPDSGQIDLRGFGENGHLRTLVLVDDHRMNRPDMAGVNWTQIPLGAIDRIEIVRGPSSVQHGSQAVGGVVHIRTRRTTPSDEPRSQAAVAAGSNEYRQARFTSSGTETDLNWYANSEAAASAGWRDRSAWRTESASVGARWDAAPDITLGGHLSYAHTESQVPGPLTWDQFEDDPRQTVKPNDEAELGAFHASLTANLELAPRLRFTIDAAQRLDETDFRFNRTLGNNQIRTLTLGPKLVGQVPVGSATATLTLGIDLSRDNLDHRGWEETGPVRLEDREADLERTILGTYLQTRIETTPGWIWTLGGRLETSRMDVDFQDLRFAWNSYSDSNTMRQHALSAGVVRRIGADSRLFARLERFYRYPTVDEIAFYQGAGAGFFPDLQPEHGVSLEVGGSARPWQRTDLHITAFHTRTHDEIVYDGTRNSNSADPVARTGLELAARARLHKMLALSTHYTAVRAVYADGPLQDRQVPLVPTHRLVTSAEVRLHEDIKLRIDALFTDAHFQGSGPQAYNFRRIPAVLLWNAALSLRSNVPTPSTHWYIAIENLFDAKYINDAYAGGVYPGTGRSIRLGMQCRF